MFNRMSLDQFYEMLIEDFGSRLYNKYHFKEPGFDEERIDSLKMLVREKLKCKSEFFAMATANKNNNLKTHPFEKNYFGRNEKNEKKQSPSVFPKEESEDDGYAYLLDSNYQQKDDFTMKDEMEENYQEVEEEVMQMDEGMDRDEWEEKENFEICNKLKDNLAIHIVGTYESNLKKHIAKDDTTYIQLENVFVKCQSNCQQIFCPILCCELKKFLNPSRFTHL